VLAGYTGANKSWLDGTGRTFEGKGPAIAYLIRDEVDGLGDDSKGMAGSREASGPREDSRVTRVHASRTPECLGAPALLSDGSPS